MVGVTVKAYVFGAGGVCMRECGGKACMRPHLIPHADKAAVKRREVWGCGCVLLCAGARACVRG